MTARFMPCDRNTSVIRVTSYQEKRIAGTLYSPGSGEEIGFENLMQMLLLMEERMDQTNTPQRGMEPRTFGDGESRRMQAVRHADSGRPVIATFQVKVLFRQHASWQGSVQWVESNMDSPFRSALELIGLMDGALTAELEKSNESNG